jgi:hypothetical protein
MDFFVRLEEKSVLASKIDLTDQACCRYIKLDVCTVSRGFSQPEGEDYDETLTRVIEEIVLVVTKTTITTMIHI